MTSTKNEVILPRYSECFVCGSWNPAGLNLTFRYHDGNIETTFVPEAKHAGYRNVTHGGILATVLDECMGWTGIISRPVLCVSVELGIRYTSPAHMGDRLQVCCQLIKDRRRMLLTQGTIRNEDGMRVCSGEGKFVPLQPEDQQAVQEYAAWNSALEDAHQAIAALHHSIRA